MRRTSLFSLLLVLLLAAPAFLHAQKRPITEKDLFDFTWIGDTQLAPDGRTAAFVQTTVAPDHTGYQTSIYLLDLSTTGARPQSAQRRHARQLAAMEQQRLTACVPACGRKGRQTHTSAGVCARHPAAHDHPAPHLRSAEGSDRLPVVARRRRRGRAQPYFKRAAEEGWSEGRRSRLRRPHHQQGGVSRQRGGVSRSHPGAAALRADLDPGQCAARARLPAHQPASGRAGVRVGQQQLDRLHRVRAQRSCLRRAVLPGRIRTTPSMPSTPRRRASSNSSPRPPRPAAIRSP